MAVVVGRLTAVLDLNAAGFTARMHAASQGVQRWNSATVGASRGTSMLRSGLQQLAFHAIGLPGPLGKITSALGMLSVGGPITLGVLAGLGGIALAYKVLTRDTTEAEEAQKGLIRALEGVGVHAKLTAARMTLGQAQAGLGDTDVSGKWFGARMLDVFRSEGQRETERQKALRAISAAENAIAAALKDVAKWQERVTVDAEREAAARSRSASLLRVVPFDSESDRMIGDALFARGQARMRGQTAGDIRHAEEARMSGDSGYFKIRGKAPADSIARIDALQIAQLAAGSMMMLAGGGGGAMVGMGTMASGLSGMAGIGAAAGPLGWIGLGLTTLGSLLSTQHSERERNEERRKNEIIGALHEGPMRQTNIFEGDPAMSLYENRRQERLGGEPRNGGL